MRVMDALELLRMVAAAYERAVMPLDTVDGVLTPLASMLELFVQTKREQIAAQREPTNMVHITHAMSHHAKNCCVFFLKKNAFNYN